MFGVESSTVESSDELKESMCVVSFLMRADLYRFDFLFVVKFVLKPFLFRLKVERCSCSMICTCLNIYGASMQDSEE